MQRSYSIKPGIVLIAGLSEAIRHDVPPLGGTSRTREQYYAGLCGVALQS